MKIYLTTDTHFGHEKIKEYCGRPDNFEELILKDLSKIKPDLLIHLGDFSLGGKDEVWHQKFMDVVKCKKWLLRGNHDKQTDFWYLQHGWDWVGNASTNFFFGKKIVFSHRPVMYSVGSFDLNIHGHFHNTLHRLLEGQWVVPGEKERNQVDLANLSEHHKLLSIEETDYKAVSLEDYLNKNDK